jgi:Holliday junction resolvase-like predicted endonuclease
MRKVSSVILGAAGEYYVMAELLRRGLIAAKAPEGVPNFDVVITDIDGQRLAAIQVKTRRNLSFRHEYSKNKS